MTHTFAELELSPTAYDEIAEKMRAAGYDHIFMEGGAIDMHGIGLTRGPDGPVVINKTAIDKFLSDPQHDIGDSIESTGLDWDGRLDAVYADYLGRLWQWNFLEKVLKLVFDPDPERQRAAFRRRQDRPSDAERDLRSRGYVCDQKEGSDIPAILRSTGLETLDPASGHDLMQIERLIKLSVPKLALQSHWMDYHRSLVISNRDDRWTVYQVPREINHQTEIRGNVAGIIECLRRIEAERFPE